MGLELDYIGGQTPIDEEEKEGLRIATISTQEELNEFEQLNIEEALQWVFSKKFKARQLFMEKFICKLHQRMLGNVWTWAGTFRMSNKNIGVDRYQIPMELKVLCDDAIYWLENETYPPDEMAIRFKHRLVSIHCFPNGNGRPSRILADIIIEHVFQKGAFSWGGGGKLSIDSDSRAAYIQAVKQADLNNYEALLKFARS